jgi:predicted RNA binding protein YcfA (HicA-like mRNA interferase family)
MSKLPLLSARELFNILSKLGFEKNKAGRELCIL